MKAYEKTCLAALDAVLQKHTTLYSVGRKKESAACIKKKAVDGLYTITRTGIVLTYPDMIPS